MFLLKGFHLSVSLNVSVRLHASDGNDFRRNLSKRTANFNFNGILLLIVNYVLMVIWFWVFAREYHDTYCYFVSFIYSLFNYNICNFKEQFKKSQMIDFAVRSVCRCI